MGKHANENKANPSGKRHSEAASVARWTFDSAAESSIPLVPELIMLGSDELRKASPLYEHEHPGCYEFVLIERGKASWELEGDMYATQAGDLFHSKPGEKHRGGFNAIEPCKFWWVIFEAPHESGWLGLRTEEIRHVAQALEQLPRVKSVGLPSADSFRKLKQALTTRNDLQSVAVRTALLDTLLAMIQPKIGMGAIAYDLLRQYDEFIARMGREPEWRPTVEQLAAAAGVSASHFYRTFQDYTGEPPITFVERLRVKEACRQLSENTDSVTDISHRLGYPSSQHFATVFKRYIGCTPTQWRKAGTRLIESNKV
ncbi:AraC family transcriptional regulator [Paenibacillus sp. LHD-117]|uniref:helix-turn-helix transcriptional regulator n=1 Tax=Paenibacillus sp. LHD-117 TaxID=3071412 RepID=UPI0027E072E1|nr:AraC family transcriptional regulator [Paenibacillus sp. LHD-117]MDQ6423487.1 AraC family transcriptional regulator [Paenibacillus sp. LHD-117]